MGKLSKVKGVKKSRSKKLAESFAEAFEQSKESIAKCAAENERKKKEFFEKYGDIEIR